eukprot:CAMPEP_0169284852 /NCGR_PEP_ID=MMETSP1016-20121227/58350_1 /TAXON_ID=342587 /ORGANISM="Karlodinium micrum, Strain CCMP2283" /LENGTH=135 /DNA_ID=CAMNT_0009374249 /DNA_START=276 /DNA_END=680 /DNA_ORIENTATION=+
MWALSVMLLAFLTGFGAIRIPESFRLAHRLIWLTSVHRPLGDIPSSSMVWEHSAWIGRLAMARHTVNTYGYQSQTTYFPEADFVISVATNVETSSQAQPADFTCLAYHEVKAVMDGTLAPKCTFVVPHRFIGKCT